MIRGFPCAAVLVSPSVKQLPTRIKVEAQLMSGEIAKDRSYPGVFYIGLGDQFDDDRRFVREVTPEFRPALGPALAGSSHPVISQ